MTEHRAGSVERIAFTISRDLLERIRDVTDTIPGCGLSEEIDREMWIQTPHENDIAPAVGVEPGGDA